MSAVSLTIIVNDLEPKACRPALAERLNRSPASSPTAEDLAKKYSQAAALREATIESVKERAQRDIERAKEATARRLRFDAAAAEKIKEKLGADDSVLEKRKAEMKLKFEAQKARRNALAAAVKASRRNASAALALRGGEMASRSDAAVSRREKALAAAKEHAAATVKHALTVAASQKDKARDAALALSDLSTSKLEAAEARRETALAASKLSAKAEKPSPRSPESAAKAKSRWAVYNDAAVESALLRRSLAEAMDKAAANREARLSSVVTKASTFNARVAQVAEAQSLDKAKGIERKSYERMVSAEVARLTALKAKASGLAKAKAPKGIVIDIDFFTSDAPKSPPSDLLRRLTRLPTTLLTSADARQAGALARRLAAAKLVAASLATLATKRVDVQRRLAAAVGKKRDALASKSKRSSLVLGERDAKRKAILTKHAANVAAVATKRAAADAATLAAGKAAALKSSKAALARAASLSATAKSAASARSERHAAFVIRREALAASASSKGAAHASRCATASAAKAATLAAIVAAAAITSNKRGKPEAAPAAPAAKPEAAPADGEADIVFVEVAK